MPKVTDADVQSLSTRIRAFVKVLKAQHFAPEKKPHDMYYWDKARSNITDTQLHLGRELEKLNPYMEENCDSEPQKRYELVRDYMDHVDLTQTIPNDRQTFDEFVHNQRSQEPSIDSGDDDWSITSKLQAMMEYSNSSRSTRS